MAVFKKMKILMLATGFPRFKGDLYGKPIYELSKRMTATDEITVLAPGDALAARYEETDNIKIIRFNYFFPAKLQKLCYGRGGIMSNLRESFLAKLNLPFFVLCFAVKVFFESMKHDIIHANWIATAFIALGAKYLFKKPIVLTERNTHLKDYPRQFAIFVLKRVDHIISPHPDITDILKSFGLNNITEIPNIVDFDNFYLPTPEQKETKKAEMGFAGKKIVLFNSRFDDWKNPLGFVNAVPLVLKRLPDTIFIMLGDGIQMNTVKNKISKLGIENSVICTGFVQNVYVYTAAADVFTSISKIENIWSNTIIEAILSGLPCVLSKAGYTEKIFTNSVNALLVEHSDTEKIANSIVKLLSDYPLREKIRKNALQIIKEKGFAPDKILSMTTEVYKTCLKNYTKTDGMLL